MKATLYDALGILPTSSDEEVRAALRGLIRKYYAKTRDGQGNVEEALRFINSARKRGIGLWMPVLLLKLRSCVRYRAKLLLFNG